MLTVLLLIDITNQVDVTPVGPTQAAAPITSKLD